MTYQQAMRHFWFATVAGLLSAPLQQLVGWLA